MKFFIVSDIKGRIRIRYGSNMFDKEQGAAIALYFRRLPYVYDVSVSHHTGSVLVYFTGGNRQNLLKEFTVLKLSELMILPLQGSGEGILTADFKRDFLKLILVKLFRRYLIPSPIREIVTLYLSLKFIRKGLSRLKKLEIGVEVLDATAVIASMAGSNFNSASNIMFLLSISEMLEEYTIKNTKNLLTESLMIHTDSIWVEQGGIEKKISTNELKIGDYVIVRNGTIIPVDGKVIRGDASVNQSSMTGEPLGVHKKVGDSVFAGTALEEGNLVIEVRSLQSDSRINQVVNLISESEELKASIQGRAERIADKIVPFSFLLSGLVFLLTRTPSKALSVLLVDYSCAIKLATPIAVISAMREASEHGIVVKGGKFFEAIAEADTIVFDKTGTLTKACPKVSKVVPMSGKDEKEILRFAACMEEHFPHSVARAIVNEATLQGLNHEEEHAQVEYIVAHGIATAIHGERAVIGSAHFLFEDESIPVTQEQRKFIDDNLGGDSAIFLAVGGKLEGFICITDPPRIEAGEAIAAMRSLGIKEIIMLTGDSKSAAEETCEKLGIDSYHAEILPEQKAEIIEKLKAEGKKVMMVGDGINDSPALAAANVSVSMKDSSDIAQEVADVLLLNSDLSQLVTVRILSQKMLRRIQNNFNAILAVNTGLLALGISNVITPSASALFHNLSTMGISALSMRPCLKSGDEFKQLEADESEILEIVEEW